MKACGMRLVVGTRDPGVVITDFNTSGVEPGGLLVVDILRSRPVPQELAAAPGKPRPLDGDMIYRIQRVQNCSTAITLRRSIKDCLQNIPWR